MLGDLHGISNVDFFERYLWGLMGTGNVIYAEIVPFRG